MYHLFRSNDQRQFCYLGRCARAGRAGTAYSLVSGDELCYLLDLHLFLGRSLSYVVPHISCTKPEMLGRIPQNLLEEQLSRIMQWHGNNSSLVSPEQFYFRYYCVKLFMLLNTVLILSNSYSNIIN